MEEEKNKALDDLRKRLLSHQELEAKVKALRKEVEESKKDFDKTEDDLKALQSVGQIIGEVLRQLDEERCEIHIDPSCHVFTSFPYADASSFSDQPQKEEGSVMVSHYVRGHAYAVIQEGIRRCTIDHQSKENLIKLLPAFSL